MSLLLVQADARHLPFADGSVQTCVTSPPYWGLRDYGIGGQLGLESTPDAYVASMVAVFREVWRVLRDDGTCWLNLGDSYQTTSGGGQQVAQTNTGAGLASRRVGAGKIVGIKPKDLVGIPWLVAFALRADGWYLRSDIIWSKPAPMPESVTDRPTKSHEYLFLLAKQERYFFDAAAIAEPSIHAGKVVTLGEKSLSRGQATGMNVTASGNGVANSVTVTATRNVRSVWTINTQPYPGAHFATMPEKLVERCVLAGSKSGDVVLDPFMGSGTVARVALKLGRRAVGCDLNPAYLKLADDRTRVTYGLPLEVA